MTAEEKLEHFQGIYITGAREHSAGMLDGYTNVLETAFEEYAAGTRRRTDMQVETETKKLEREINKRLSIGQLDLKEEASRKQKELKDKLSVKLRDKLANFMETQGYQRLLDRQARAAKEFIGDEELIIYVDPSGVDKLQRITIHRNATIKVSEYSFNGGTRAVFPGKHILIDSSFQTKLSEARHEFKFDLTGGRQSG